MAIPINPANALAHETRAEREVSMKPDVRSLFIAVYKKVRNSFNPFRIVPGNAFRLVEAKRF